MRFQISDIRLELNLMITRCNLQQTRVVPSELTNKLENLSIKISDSSPFAANILA